MRACACIERGRLWQAEHYVGAVRDHALSLACLREGVQAVQARGYDDLSAETLARLDGAHVGAIERIAFPKMTGELHPIPAIASMALDLLKDADLRAAIVAESQERGRERLSFQTMRSRLAKFFAQLIGV